MVEGPPTSVVRVNRRRVRRDGDGAVMAIVRNGASPFLSTGTVLKNKVGKDRHTRSDIIN